MPVWFGIQHRCEDGQWKIDPEFHWKKDDQGNDLSPRTWLVCDDCHYEVRMVTKAPGTVLVGDVAVPPTYNQENRCPVCHQAFSPKGLRIHQGMQGHGQVPFG